MLNFDFHNPTHIVFGQGRIADLAKLVPAAAKVLILVGGGESLRYQGQGERQPGHSCASCTLLIS